MAWWDEIVQWVEDRKKDYEELDKNLGGWLPGGYEGPPPPQEAIPEWQEPFRDPGYGIGKWTRDWTDPNRDAPGEVGIKKAWEDAWAPTNPQGDYLDKVVRDVEVIGGLARTLEVPFGLAEQGNKRFIKPLWGTMEYNNPNEVKWRADGRPEMDLWQLASDFLTSKPGQPDTVPASMARLREGLGAALGTPEQQEAGRQKFEQLSTPSQIGSIPFDPVNWINPGNPLTGFKQAGAVASAIKPINEMTRLERLASSTPAVRAGAEGIEQALGMGLDQLRTPNPITKIPGLAGLGIGRLSGASKVAEDVATLKDTLGSTLAHFVKQGEDMDLAEVVTTLGRIVNPVSQEAEAALGASRLSRETLVARQMLKDANPTSVIAKYEQGQVVGKELAAMQSAKQAGQAVDEAALQKLTDLYKTLPKNKLNAFADMGRDLIDAGAAVSAKAHNLTEDNVIRKIAQKTKNGLAYAFLAANVNYPVQNIVNNWAMTILAGLNPFSWPGRAGRVMKREGFGPIQLGRMEAAMGQADVPMAHRLLGKILGGGMTVAQWAERLQSENLFLRAFEKVKGGYMDASLPKEIIPQELVARLGASDPRLPGRIYDIIRHEATTAPEAVKMVNKLLGGGMPPLTSFLPDTLKADNDLMALIKPAMARMQREADKVTRPEDVAPLLSSMFKQIDDWLAAVKTPVIKVPPTGTGKTVKGGKAAKAVEPTLDNARATLVNFLDKFEESRANAFVKTAQMAENWTGTPTELVAAKREMWNGVWQGIADMVNGVVKSAEGYADETVLSNLRKTFADWATEARSANYEYELALKEFGHDTVRLDAEAANIFLPYTARMKSITSKANASLYRLMEKVVYPDGISADAAPLFKKYWDNVFKGVPGEEDWMKSLNAQIAAATKKHASEVEIKAIRDSMNAERQAKAAIWNKEQKALRQKLFGEAQPAPANLKSQNVIPAQPIGTPKAQAQVQGQTVAEAATTTVPAPKPSPVAQGADIANDPYIYMADEGAKVMRQALEAMGRGLQDSFSAQPTGALDAATRKELINWISTLNPAYADARTAAIKVANQVRDFGMLNYTHRYEFDNNLAMLMPFAFWLTQTGKNMAVRFVEQPGMYFAYSKFKQMIDNTDIPARFQGMLPFRIPGAPDWMGTQYINPLAKAMPFNSLEYPMQSAQWTEEGDNPALAVLGGVGAVTPFIDVPRKLLGLGGGKPDEIGPLFPATRTIKGFSSVLKEAGVPFADRIPAGGWNIEKELGIRDALRKVGGPTVPDFDKWGTYREERMVNDMAGEGSITPEQAKEAIRTKTGPIWERAVQRVGVEMGIGQLPILAGAVQMKTYPKGEAIQNTLAKGENALVLQLASKEKGTSVTDLTEAWAIVKKAGLTGKGGPIDQFNKENPTLTVKKYLSDTPIERETADTWDALNVGTVPNKWKTANLSKEEQAALQKFYDAGKVDGLTPAEKTLLQGALAKLETGRATPEFQNIAVLGKEINALIDQEFARLGGPAGETNKYDWITKANGGKTTATIAKWYADHPEYSNYGKAAGAATTTTTYAPAGAGKDPVLYKEITDLIDSEFQRLGGPAGTTNKYDWIKQANGGKTTSAIAKWYADHPGYSSGSGSGSGSTYRPYTSTYKPYTPIAKAPVKVLAGKELSFLSKWTTADVVKAFKLYAKSGKLPPGLAQKLYTIYQTNKGMLVVASFEEWIRTLLKQAA